jgi:antitoxin ParD1/3/4
MNITLNSEIEQLISVQLALGEYTTIEELLKDALLTLAEKQKRQLLSYKVNNLFNKTQSLPNVKAIIEEEIQAEIEAYRRGE